MTQINLTVIAKGPNKWASYDTMEIDFQKAKKPLLITTLVLYSIQ